MNQYVTDSSSSSGPLDTPSSHNLPPDLPPRYPHLGGHQFAGHESSQHWTRRPFLPIAHCPECRAKFRLSATTGRATGCNTERPVIRSLCRPVARGEGEQVVEAADTGFYAIPQHFLYFLPDPQGQESFLPTFAPIAERGGAYAVNRSPSLLTVASRRAKRAR